LFCAHGHEPRDAAGRLERVGDGGARRDLGRGEDLAAGLGDEPLAGGEAVAVQEAEAVDRRLVRVSGRTDHDRRLDPVEAARRLRRNRRSTPRWMPWSSGLVREPMARAISMWCSIGEGEIMDLVAPDTSL